MYESDLPHQLLEKHLPDLALADPARFETEEDLFRTAGAKDLAPSAIVFLPKSKALIDMTLALAAERVAKGGTIVLAGSNDAGIRSARDAYERIIGPIREKLVGSHSALYVGTNERRGAGKDIADFLSFAPVSSHGETLELANLPGVFSAGELDHGTRLLLEHLPHDRASLLDVGAGAGAIGAFYKKMNPNPRVVMSDASRLATYATKATLDKNDIKGEIILSDVFDSIDPDARFDLIVTNPPFHKGIRTDYSFIERFAKGAKRHLARGGEVWVVANSFLPYGDILTRHIGPTEIVADDGKFRVFKSKTA